jgi:hypothetical protein
MILEFISTKDCAAGGVEAVNIQKGHELLSRDVENVCDRRCADFTLGGFGAAE